MGAQSNLVNGIKNSVLVYHLTVDRVLVFISFVSRKVLEVMGARETVANFL